MAKRTKQKRRVAGRSAKPQARVARPRKPKPLPPGEYKARVIDAAEQGDGSVRVRMAIQHPNDEQNPKEITDVIPMSQMMRRLTVRTVIVCTDVKQVEHLKTVFADLLKDSAYVDYVVHGSTLTHNYTYGIVFSGCSGQYADHLRRHVASLRWY